MLVYGEYRSNSGESDSKMSSDTQTTKFSEKKTGLNPENVVFVDNRKDLLRCWWSDLRRCAAGEHVDTLTPKTHKKI